MILTEWETSDEGQEWCAHCTRYGHIAMNCKYDDWEWEDDDDEAIDS